MFACVHVPGVATDLRPVVEAFSPRVEALAPDTVLLDIGGLGPLFGSPEDVARAIAARLGPDARVAVAANPEAAVHAARGFPGVTLIPPGGEAEVLGNLPVAALAPPEEVAETLARWGIRTLRELAALPEEGLSERLGPESVRLHRLARGAGLRPLVPAAPAPVFEEMMELEYPVAELEPLAFILGRLLNQLCAGLASRGLATNELRLALKLESRTEHNRTHRLPFPMRDSRAFLKLIQLDLESHPPEAPVIAVSLAAAPAGPRVVQNGLFVPPVPEPEKLELTLARLKNLIGEDNVGSPELLDTHRPGAFRMKRFVGRPLRPRPGSQPGPRPLALRLFRPPLYAKVQAPAGRPAEVVARSLRGKVIDMAGPWRTSSDWWRYDAWSRDEWDVALSNGALYRVYYDRLAGGWFVEGSYD